MEMSVNSMFNFACDYLPTYFLPKNSYSFVYCDDNTYSKVHTQYILKWFAIV